jgi:hypothetical protein
VRRRHFWNGAGGRKKGAPRVTEELSGVATRLVRDHAYVAALKVRLRKGQAGLIEPLLWLYAYGEPPQAERELPVKQAGIRR